MGSKGAQMFRARLALMPRTSEFLGLSTTKSYQSTSPPGLVTRWISSAHERRSLADRMLEKTRLIVTRSMLASL